MGGGPQIIVVSALGKVLSGIGLIHVLITTVSPANITLPSGFSTGMAAPTVKEPVLSPLCHSLPMLSHCRRLTCSAVVLFFAVALSPPS